MKLLAQKTKLVLHEDNQSALQIIKTGKNSTMRHLSRAHGISISALHDYCKLPGVTIVYVLSEEQCADIFTKCFKLATTWMHVSNLIGMSQTGSKGSKAFKVLPPAPRKPKQTEAATEETNTEVVAKCYLSRVGICGGNAYFPIPNKKTFKHPSTHPQDKQNHWGASPAAQRSTRNRVCSWGG